MFSLFKITPCNITKTFIVEQTTQVMCHNLVSFYEEVGSLKMHIEMLRFVHPLVKLEK
jgi:hypothetical protein